MSRWRQRVACDILVSMIADRWAKYLFTARNHVRHLNEDPLISIGELIENLETGINDTSHSIECKEQVWSLTSFPPASEINLEEIRTAVRDMQKLLPKCKEVVSQRNAAAVSTQLAEMQKEIDKQHARFQKMRDRNKGLSLPGVLQTGRLVINSKVAVGLASAALTIAVASLTVILPKYLQQRDFEMKHRTGLQQRVETIHRGLMDFPGKSINEQQSIYLDIFNSVIGSSNHPTVDPDLSVGICIIVDRLGYQFHLTNGFDQAAASASGLTRYLNSGSFTNFSTTAITNFVEAIHSYSRNYPAQ